MLANILERLYAAWKERDLKKSFSVAPLAHYHTVEKQGDPIEGKKLLKSGKAGCLIVAGGQGTRLGFDGPKGCFEIFPGKSLFRIFAEKTLFHSKECGFPLPLAIMTSMQNHKQVISHFEQNEYFGLQATQVGFFTQGEFPFLDEQGKLLKTENGATIQGPSGNGVSLLHFVESGICSQWQQQGIEYVSFVQIDNPLADPFDPALLGYHHNYPADATIKAILRDDPLEKVGVILLKEGKVAVVEYNEISDEEKLTRNIDDKLRHPCANISLFCFNLTFIQQLYELQAWEKMPLHFAHKPIASVPGQWGYKSEYYIFDVLPFAKNVNVLVYPRASCFAPFKELSDLEAVRNTL